MIGAFKFQKYVRVITLGIATIFGGCSPTDRFSQPSIELIARLRLYVQTQYSPPVIEWATQYHGEAPSQQMMVDFVTWGNSNPKEMTVLLKQWPIASCQEILERLRGAATDSGQPIVFAIPDR